MPALVAGIHVCRSCCTNDVDGRDNPGHDIQGKAMANITSQMVKELRDQTGAGLMDCKAALTETGGKIEPAVDWLRKKGLAKAAKKAGRVAAEGLVGVALVANKGIVVEVNSETDFVARNDHFQGLVKMIAQAALKAGTDVEAIKAARAGSGTIGEAIASSIATIGENMTLRRAAALCVDRGVVASYVHATIAEGLGRIGVLVALQSAGDAAGLGPDVIARERSVLAEKFRAQGKPANVIEKIVDSGLKTFYKEVCLLDQEYIYDTAKTVSQAVKEAEGKIGAPIKIGGFVRYALGEGKENPATQA